MTEEQQKKIDSAIISKYKAGKCTMFYIVSNIKIVLDTEDIDSIAYLNYRILEEFTYNETQEYTNLVKESFSSDTVYYKLTQDLLDTWKAEHPIPGFFNTEDHIPTAVRSKGLANYFEQNNKSIFISQPGNKDTIQYNYKDGVYTKVGQAEMKSILRQYIESTAFAYDLTELATDKIISAAYRDVSIAPTPGDIYSTSDLNKNEWIINLKNGMLVFDTKGNYTFKKHTDKILSTIQLPVEYAAEGELPQPERFIQFVNECIVEEDRENFLKYFAVILSNFTAYRIKKVAFLQGQKDCGKSVMFSLVQYLVGEDENCFELDLANADGRFKLASCFGKRLGGQADLKLSVIKDVGTFKRLSGGDTIECEFKGIQGFSYKYTGALLFACNHIPRLIGADDSTFERLLPIRCNPPIPEENRTTSLLDQLKAESQSIVMYLIPYLQQVIRDDFKIKCSPGSAELVEKLKTGSSNVVSFLKKFCSRNPGKGYCRFKPDVVYSLYQSHCREEGDTNIRTRPEFVAEVEDHYHINDIYSSKKDKSGNSCRVYKIYINYLAIKSELGINLLQQEDETGE